MYQHLLHPDLLEAIPLTGRITANLIEDYAVLAADSLISEQDITVVIRTLNEAKPLERLFEDIHRQFFSKEVEIIVVDNASSDQTPQVVHSHGAEVVSIARGEFTHPRSMNAGMKAASHEIVMLTVGHAGFTNTQVLRAGSLAFAGGLTGGVFGVALPNVQASKIDYMTAIGVPQLLTRERIQKVGIGVMGATNALISRTVWKELGMFDERYERGGEDSAMAVKILAAGLDILREPAVAVHHSHGLGLVDSAHQWYQWWRTLHGPQHFNQAQWAKRRPDLDFR